MTWPLLLCLIPILLVAALRIAYIWRGPDKRKDWRDRYNTLEIRRASGLVYRFDGGRKRVNWDWSDIESIRELPGSGMTEVADD